jgi:hypothetical protein
MPCLSAGKVSATFALPDNGGLEGLSNRSSTIASTPRVRT